MFGVVNVEVPQGRRRLVPRKDNFLVRALVQGAPGTLVTVLSVATIAASKRVMIALVVVSLTACRRVVYDLKVCSWLNENMITITVTSVYHCHCVLRLQVILFDVANIIAECC